MWSLRRYYHRHCGYHGRFHLAVVLTIVVVSYVLVPWLVTFFDGARAYSPFYYEPKDFTRQDYLLQHGVPASAAAPWKLIVNLALVLLVAIVWIAILPPRAGRR